MAREKDSLAQLAGTVQVGRKIGKIIAAGASGGAVGAGAETVRQFPFIIVSLLVLALLPVLVVLMLPSVIFGGWDAPITDALNNDELVAENIITIQTGVREILQAAYESALADIDAQREGLDYSDITDNVGGQVVFQASSLIAMYCAYQGESDCSQINVDHMLAAIRAHQDELFTYETDTENRTVAVPHNVQQTVNGQVQTVVVNVDEQHEFTVYTLNYVGDSYFAETAWALTEEQQATSNAYAQNLTLYLYELKADADLSILSDLDALLGDAPGDVTPLPDGVFANPFNDPDWRSCITSRFGRRADVGLPGKNTTNHNGLDIAKPYGTPILAVQSGTVVTAGWHNSYGNYVILNHGGGVCTLYAHCSRLLVQVGDVVSQYDTIAQVGSTGDSTGNHLHICVILDGVYVDPEGYLN